MGATLRLSVQILDQPPPPYAASPSVVTRQVWQGGVTDLTTRTMIASPPRWLVLADHEGPAQATVAAASAGGTPLLSWELEQILPGDAASPADAGGVILVSMDVDPAREDEFNDWYNTEHIPHFRKVPGVIAARRFRALRGSPAYVALYHVTDTDVYATPGWMAANETPWILRMRRYQRNRTYFMFRRKMG
jgi:hypothetical protein